MKKMLYITNTEFNKNSTGIGYKIYKQTELFKRNNFDVKVYNNFTDSRFLIRLLYLLPFCNCKYRYEEIMKERNISAIYIRYFLSDAKLVSMIKTLKQNNPGVKVLVEIPTYPYDGEIFEFAPKLIKDKMHRLEFSKYVDRFITFSDDKEIFGVPAINISNAVDTQKINIIECSEKVDEEINLIAVAQFDFWHGYDRVIEGLNQYYQQGGKTNFVFHIVGYAKNAKILNYYNELVSKYNLQDRVVFHGEKHGSELDQIYNKCSLAIDSLGRHRSKVFYNSSLKGKEYMAKGLPIISGVKTELDNDNSFHYYLRIPADDSPMNFNEVETYYHSIYDNEEREKVVHNIRLYCENNFTFENAYKSLIEYIKI